MSATFYNGIATLENKHHIDESTGWRQIAILLPKGVFSIRYYELVYPSIRYAQSKFFDQHLLYALIVKFIIGPNCHLD